MKCYVGLLRIAVAATIALIVIVIISIGFVIATGLPMDLVFESGGLGVGPYYHGQGQPFIETLESQELNPETRDKTEIHRTAYRIGWFYILKRDWERDRYTNEEVLPGPDLKLVSFLKGAGLTLAMVTLTTLVLRMWGRVRSARLQSSARSFTNDESTQAQIRQSSHEK